MIPPQELTKTTFSKGLKGYEPTEVDEYISFLIEKYTELFAQCDEYQGKLRLVRDRISEMQSEEEAIHKLMISTQKYCDTLKEESKQKASEILREAQEKSQEIINEAEIEEERILTNAKQLAERTLLAISRKAEEQIEDSNEKSEALLMSARTRCAKILNEFKKEIAIQRNGLLNLKAMADNFNDTILGLYKEHLNSLTENMPEMNLNLDELTESGLLSSIMQDIKRDAANIAEKNGNKEYDFQDELSALKIDIDATVENIPKKFLDAAADENVKAGASSATANSRINSGSSNDDNFESEESAKTAIFTKVSEIRSEEDVKVFAGKTSEVSSESVSGGDTMVFDKNTVNFANSAKQEQPEQHEEETIATYDSDDFNQDKYDMKNARDAVGDERESGRDFENPSGYSSKNEDNDDDSYNDDEDDEDEDEGSRSNNGSRKVGFLGSLFGKKKNNKKKNASKDDDIEYELDDDDYDIDIDDL